MLTGLNVTFFPLIIIVTGLLLLEPLKKDHVLTLELSVMLPPFLSSNRMKIRTLIFTLSRNRLVNDLLELGYKHLVLSFNFCELSFFYERTFGIKSLSIVFIIHLDIDLRLNLRNLPIVYYLTLFLPFFSKNFR